MRIEARQITGVLALVTSFAPLACAGSVQGTHRATEAPPAPSGPTAAPNAVAPQVESAPPASAAPATVVPDSVASAPPSAPRPSTIALGDGELAAGDAAFEKQDFAEAQRHYEAAPTGAARSVGLARVRIARVQVPLDYGAARGNAEVRASEIDLARAARAAPGLGPAFVELGRARLLLGDASGAIEALRNGVRLLPQEPEAHSQLGVALLATGHAADAVLELARAAELDPGSGPRHGNLGTALMMAGRTKDAIVEYETRVRIDDADSRAHSDLGTALLGTQDLPRALSELERAVQLDPVRPAFHSNLGYALQQLGRIDRAVAEYRLALKLDPNLVSAWINLATALARDPKTRAEAHAALARAKALSSDDPRVKANIDELDALEKIRAPPAERP